MTDKGECFQQQQAESALHRKKVLSLIGCMLCHFVLHLSLTPIVIWVAKHLGKHALYMCSYLREFDPTLSVDSMFMVMPIYAIATNIGNMVGLRLLKKFSPHV